jgi:hypothetical protein
MLIQILKQGISGLLSFIILVVLPKKRSLAEPVANEELFDHLFLKD